MPSNVLIWLDLNCGSVELMSRLIFDRGEVLAISQRSSSTISEILPNNTYPTNDDTDDLDPYRPLV